MEDNLRKLNHMCLLFNELSNNSFLGVCLLAIMWQKYSEYRCRFTGVELTLLPLQQMLRGPCFGAGKTHIYNSKNNTEIYRKYTLEYQNIGLKFKN